MGVFTAAPGQSDLENQDLLYSKARVYFWGLLVLYNTN